MTGSGSLPQHQIIYGAKAELFSRLRPLESSFIDQVHWLAAQPDNLDPMPRERIPITELEFYRYIQFVPFPLQYTRDAHGQEVLALTRLRHSLNTGYHWPEYNSPVFDLHGHMSVASASVVVADHALDDDGPLDGFHFGQVQPENEIPEEDILHVVSSDTAHSSSEASKNQHLEEAMSGEEDDARCFRQLYRRYYRHHAHQYYCRPNGSASASSTQSRSCI